MVQNKIKSPISSHNGVEREKTPINIEALRIEIDAIDTQLLQLLSQRMVGAQKVGVYKKEHNLPIFQAERWQEILNGAKLRGRNLGLSDEFITCFFTTIHTESMEYQTLVMQEEDAFT